MNSKPENRMRHVLERINRMGLAPVAVFGAGQHTRKVIGALLDSPVTIAAFVDASPDRQAEGLCGWPVIPPSALGDLGVRSLVINSDRYEADIWAGRAQFEALGIQVFRLYPESGNGACPGDIRTLPDIEAAMSGREHLSVDALRSYWSTRGARAADESNSPKDYRQAVWHSLFLADWIAQCSLPLDARILELGCNVGRNLAFLRYRGYTNLSGVDINPHALVAMHEFYPETAEAVEVKLGSLEEVLPSLPSNSYDMVFSMAVLEHIHTDSDFLFDHVVRVTRRYICTIEDERSSSPRHFPRDYGLVWTQLGCRPIHVLPFREAGIEQITLLHLDENFVARLVEKTDVPAPPAP